MRAKWWRSCFSPRDYKGKIGKMMTKQSCTARIQTFFVTSLSLCAHTLNSVYLCCRQMGFGAKNKACSLYFQKPSFRRECTESQKLVKSLMSPLMLLLLLLLMLLGTKTSSISLPPRPPLFSSFFREQSKILQTCQKFLKHWF